MIQQQKEVERKVNSTSPTELLESILLILYDTFVPSNGHDLKIESE